MKFTVERNWIDILGTIWQPGVGPCSIRLDLSKYDMENIGEPTKENVDLWLLKNAVDFRRIIDFHAVIGEVTIPWTSEDNEMTYNAD